jgi:hypothetical protein
LFKKQPTFKKPASPTLKEVDKQTVSSKIDRNRDGSSILVFPVEEDEYFVVPM